MKVLFAPLEGITGYIFRTTYEKYFGGIDAYYTPFVTTRDGGIMKNKEKWDILPENNPGITVVPQIMTAKADEFIQAARHMEEMGYTEVNLNLGCPSGTVVPKGKGSGFLRHPDELDDFLGDIYGRCPIGISIKSRIGYSSPEEFPALLDIYNKYPIKLLILHLRTRSEMYEGAVHPDIYEYAYNNATMPLCYNGDIRTSEDVSRIKDRFPGTSVNDQAEEGYVMIGRGFLSYPGFAGGTGLKGSFEDRTRILAFVKELQGRYEEVLYGETPVLFKMKELWSHLKDSFGNGDELFRRIKKVKHLDQFNHLMEELDFAEIANRLNCTQNHYKEVLS